jgi:hypothetical protein
MKTKDILLIGAGLGVIAIGYYTYKQLSKSAKITTTQQPTTQQAIQQTTQQAPIQQTQQPNGVEAYQQFQQTAQQLQQVSNQVILEAHKQTVSKIESDPSLTSESKQQLIASASGITLQKIGVAPTPQQYQQIAGTGNKIIGTPEAPAPGTPAGSVAFEVQTANLGKVKMYYDPWTKQYVIYG